LSCSPLEGQLRELVHQGVVIVAHGVGHLTPNLGGAVDWALRRLKDVVGFRRSRALEQGLEFAPRHDHGAESVAKPGVKRPETLVARIGEGDNEVSLFVRKRVHLQPSRLLDRQHLPHRRILRRRDPGGERKLPLLRQHPRDLLLARPTAPDEHLSGPLTRPLSLLERLAELVGGNDPRCDRQRSEGASTRRPDLARWRRQIPKQIEFVHARPFPVQPSQAAVQPAIGTSDGLL
jgi:hypothetical protein